MDVSSNKSKLYKHHERNLHNHIQLEHAHMCSSHFHAHVLSRLNGASEKKLLKTKK